ncbi:MAG: carbohydrate porin [Flavobacterium psychrophilum]|nr:MAG: carbohydrate porin [Flavobacterium psychrophilum]
MAGHGLHAQEADTLKEDQFSIHAQTTVISQYKPGFTAKYTGDNSLLTGEETQTSLTATLFAGVRLWKGASVFVNPEIAGGSGLSQAMGVAAATNGETFRIGNAAPKGYLARLFYRQVFALSKTTTYEASDANQLGQHTPDKYVAFTVGKVGVADYFDDNKYSHDPRSQFMSWALMDNGAWDYPANTRGYAPSIILEWVTPQHELRYGFSLVPLVANGPKMNWNISKAHSQSLEYTQRYAIHQRAGAIRLLGFYTTTNMGNYRESIALKPTNPSIESTRHYGNSKFGFALNGEQDITDELGGFFRASWNNGIHETWAFTEIDRSISAGLSLTGTRWKRSNDHVGLAYVTSGLSRPHREYLAAGGKGFMLGDGALNYAWERLAEFYYSAALSKDKIFLTGTYQFLMNPGYNGDRKGPVNVLSVRLHVNI